MSLNNVRGRLSTERARTASKFFASALFLLILIVAAPSSLAEESVSEPDHEQRLRELEQNLDELREEISRSRSRLRSLRDQLLTTDVDASHAVIKHVNNTDGAFALEEVTYVLDGNPLYSETNADGELSRRNEIEVFNGVILPGIHQLRVEMTFTENTHSLFQGSASGRFTTRSNYAFTAEAGKVAQVDVISFGEGEETELLEERADVRYELTFVDAVAFSD